MRVACEVLFHASL